MSSSSDKTPSSYVRGRYVYRKEIRILEANTEIKPKLLLLNPKPSTVKSLKTKKQLQTVSQHQYSVSKNCMEELSSSRDPGKH